MVRAASSGLLTKWRNVLTGNLQGTSQGLVLLKLLLVISLMDYNKFLLNLQMTGKADSILKDRHEFRIISTSRSMIWNKRMLFNKS